MLSAAPIFSGITFGYRLLESVKATWCWREMGDEGIKREVWEGKVPVCFSVAEEEVGLNRVRERVVPEPCYVSRRAECLVSGMSPRGVVTGQYHKIGDLGIIFFCNKFGASLVGENEGPIQSPCEGKNRTKYIALWSTCK